MSKEKVVVNVTRKMLQQIYDSEIPMAQVKDWAAENLGITLSSQKWTQTLNKAGFDLRKRKRGAQVEINIVDEESFTEDQIEDIDTYKNEAQEVVASWQQTGF